MRKPFVWLLEQALTLAATLAVLFVAAVVACLNRLRPEEEAA